MRCSRFINQVNRESSELKAVLRVIGSVLTAGKQTRCARAVSRRCCAGGLLRAASHPSRRPLQHRTGGTRGVPGQSRGERPVVYSACGHFLPPPRDSPLPCLLPTVPLTHPQSSDFQHHCIGGRGGFPLTGKKAASHRCSDLPGHRKAAWAPAAEPSFVQCSGRNVSLG